MGDDDGRLVTGDNTQEDTRSKSSPPDSTTSTARSITISF